MFDLRRAMTWAFLPLNSPYGAKREGRLKEVDARFMAKEVSRKEKKEEKKKEKGLRFQICRKNDFLNLLSCVF